MASWKVLSFVFLLMVSIAFRCSEVEALNMQSTSAAASTKYYARADFYTNETYGEIQGGWFIITNASGEVYGGFVAYWFGIIFNNGEWLGGGICRLAEWSYSKYYVESFINGVYTEYDGEEPCSEIGVCIHRYETYLWNVRLFKRIGANWTESVIVMDINMTVTGRPIIAAFGGESSRDYNVMQATFCYCLVVTEKYCLRFTSFAELKVREDFPFMIVVENNCFTVKNKVKLPWQKGGWWCADVCELLY